MKVKDLIWKLQQIYNQEKEVNFGSSRIDEKQINMVIEREFVVYLIND